MGISMLSDDQQHDGPSACCCAVCLGILQGEEGAGHAAVAEIEAVVKRRGYELLAEGGAERPLGFALGLSLPYCEAIRTRACWYVRAILFIHGLVHTVPYTRVYVLTHTSLHHDFTKGSG